MIVSGEDGDELDPFGIGLRQRLGSQFYTTVSAFVDSSLVLGTALWAEH